MFGTNHVVLVLALAFALPLRTQAQSATPQAAPDGRAGSRAAATPNNAPSDSELNISKARMHFLLGMQFFEVRAYRDAIREFELATTLAPSADVWFNIGRAREELGEDEQAKAAFERYLRDRVDAPDAAAVRARVNMIQGRIQNGRREAEPATGTGSLRIHFAAPAAPGVSAPAAPKASAPAAPESVITLDGKTLRSSARLQPLILPAGRHRLEVTQAGFVPFRAEVSIEPGMLTAAHARLDPLSPPPRAAPAHARTWTWVVLGVAGASAVATGVFGAIASDRQSEGDVSSASTWAQRSDVALAGTAVCALAAAILYFVEAPQPHVEAVPSGARAERAAVVGGGT